MSPKPPPYAIYARQSLDKKLGREGEGLAVDRQLADCRDLARRLGLKGEPVIYTDNDLSASSGKPRPAYLKLLRALRDGKHRTLLVWHTDRLHRRPVELEEFIDVSNSAGVVTHTVKAGMFDLATPSGRMVARHLGTAARYEVEHKGERQKAAIRQGAMAGRRHGGGRSFGYGRTVIERGRDGQEVRRATDIHEVNKVEAAAIRSAFDQILHGASTTSIWKAWNARGLLTQFGNQWDGTTFRNMIKRPSLAGIVVYQGERQDGVESAWPAIVDRAKWDAVQSIITDPTRRTSPGPTPRHLCGGVTFCECGRPMRTATNSIKSKRTGVSRNFGVYRCMSDEPGHSTIVREKLDDAVRSAVIDSLWRSNGTPVKRSSDDEAALVPLHNELEQVREREGRLAEAIADGVVSKAAAAKTSAKIAEDVRRLSGEIDEIARRSVSAGMLDETYAAMLAEVADRPEFEPLGPNRQRWNVGKSLILGMEKRGMARAEAIAKLELGRRFDDLTVEQQRSLVRSLVRVDVLRGQGDDRIAAKPL